MIKYFFGKTSKSLQKIKSNFIEDNSSHLKIQEKIEKSKKVANKIELHLKK